MLVVSDLEFWDIVQESDNVAVIYLTQEFWMGWTWWTARSSPASTHQPGEIQIPTAEGLNRLFQSSESRWSKYSWGTAVQGLSCQAENQQPELLSAPGSEDSHTLNAPSRAAQVPASAARTSGVESRFFSSCYTACWCRAAHCLTHNLCMGGHTHLSNTYIFINDISLCVLQKQC